MLPPPLTHTQTQYKYPEGSDWERRALYEGYDELMKETRDVQFEVPEVTFDFGQNVTFVVKATNKGRQHRIKGRIHCQATSYTGRYYFPLLHLYEGLYSFL